MKKRLTIKRLTASAAEFAEIETAYDEPTLYGVTDGKAVGTYLERKFKQYLSEECKFKTGNAASGIDLPEIGIDIKATSIRQPQSSCPFKSAKQKVYGLGYHLLVFVYDKYDDHENQTGRLDIKHTIFVRKERSADFQTTKGIIDIIDRDGNKDDIIAFLAERNLPLDDVGANDLANEILNKPPELGYLTISNALQWRLQYSRVINEAGSVSGIDKVK